MYSDMSTWIIASSSPKRNSASVRASLGLPDAGRAEEDERAGRALRVLDPRARAADRLRDGDDRGLLADHALVELLLHADELLRLGLGELEDRDPRPHRDDVGDLVLADLRLLLVGLVAPALLELLLLLRELALLVAERRGLLELLRLDRRFLVGADGLDLLLELAVARRRGHRPDADARAGLVDQVDRLVGQVPVLDVAVGERRGRAQRLVGDLARGGAPRSGRAGRAGSARSRRSSAPRRAPAGSAARAPRRARGTCGTRRASSRRSSAARRARAPA